LVVNNVTRRFHGYHPGYHPGYHHPGYHPGYHPVWSKEEEEFYEGSDSIKSLEGHAHKGCEGQAHKGCVWASA